ncbi:hypothetical protein SAMN05216490_1884 [Mucilaginibacter mallensis]|uniref:Uncharacterized protein n=1 Tax=Mucilaginibacter mallensis TaxID=652787 RepID=A0A1H1VC27_MUCMA|nr:hypothetical protein [Mucilaginibacter mallensis]SDS82233.1 hypothetical protein SAMN05216490_1884 [Mucilaginibacter mallensis]
MDSADNVFLYIIGYIIAFVVGIFITRAVFSIPKFLKLQAAQLEVLVEIAKQQGVKPEVLFMIHSSNDLRTRAQTNEEIRAEAQKSRIFSDEALEREALSHPKE